MRARDSLAVPEFRGMIAAQIASEAGDQIARVALALLVLDQTGSALWAAATFALAYIPSTLGAAILGPIADRASRRNVMLVSDLARAVLVGVLALVAVDGTPLFVLFALLLVAELFTPAFDAARTATIPDVLGDPALVTAGFGLSRSLNLVNQVVGLALGGAVVQLLSSRWALGLDAFSFVISFLILQVTLRRRDALLQGGTTLKRLFADFREGASAVANDPARRALIGLLWAMGITIVAPEAVALAYARQEGASNAAGSILMAVTIAGAAIGSVMIGSRPALMQLDLILPMVIGCSIPLLLMGPEPPIWATAVLFAIAGASQAWLVPVIAFTTLLTMPEQRGRVAGLMSAGFSLSAALSYLLVGFLADRTSPAFAVVCAGAFGLIVVCVASARWPARHVRQAVRSLDEHF